MSMNCNKKTPNNMCTILWRPDIHLLVNNQNKHAAMASEHISIDFSVSS